MTTPKTPAGQSVQFTPGIHRYKGYNIIPWAGPYGMFPDAGEPKWFIQVQHDATGLDYDAQHCPKAWSLRHAREIINGNRERQRPLA